MFETENDLGDAVVSIVQGTSVIVNSYMTPQIDPSSWKNISNGFKVIPLSDYLALLNSVADGMCNGKVNVVLNIETIGCTIKSLEELMDQ